MEMLVSDYDGTFYRNDDEVVTNIDKVDKFMKKNIFVIATGRSLLDFKKKEDMYKIKYNYLIINHGASIIKDSVIIHNEIIDNSIKNDLIIDLKRKKIIDEFACREYESRLKLEDKNLTKIHVSYDSPKDAKNIYNLIINKYGKYISAFLVSNFKSIEIVSVNANKSIAISKIAKLENISISDIYTIGDGYSDIQMIKDFNGFIMSNGLEEVKKYAIKTYDGIYNLIDDLSKGVIL